jgi:hypothetical protein
MAGVLDLGPMTAVRAFVDGINSDDVDLIQAACEEETLIIDDFPPHTWSGSRAATRWYQDMARMASDFGMSGWSVRLEGAGKVMGDDGSAYVVVPVDLRWLEDGAPAQRVGYMAIAAQEGSQGWRISACAWTWY